MSSTITLEIDGRDYGVSIHGVENVSEFRDALQQIENTWRHEVLGQSYAEIFSDLIEQGQVEYETALSKVHFISSGLVS